MVEYITLNISDTALMVDSKFERKLDKIIRAVKKAKEIVGESADEVYVLRKRTFKKVARRFKKFALSSPTVVATTEFETGKRKLKTRTFVNAASSLVRKNLKDVLAHEFAHIKHYKNEQIVPIPRFKKSLPAEAKRFAMIFLTEIEEVLADALLPARMRNKKNREIIKLVMKKDALPHPLFLLALKVTTRLSLEESEIIEKILRESVRELGNAPFPFNPVEKLYRKIFEQKEIKRSDIPLIENVLNMLIEKLYGVKNACRFS